MPRARNCLCLLAGLLLAPPALGALKVEPDEENVVAGRLEGTWVQEADLSARLQGEARDADLGALTFVSDPTVAGKVPERYHEHLAGKRIYLAGTFTFREEAHPFLLLTLHGNPHLIYFRERDGDPMGDAESFNLVVAAAEERAKDLLFLGGDFNPDLARGLYCGRRSDAPERPPQAEPVVRWLKAVQEGDLDLLESVFSARMRAKLEEEGWEEVLTAYREVFQEELGDYSLADLRFTYEGDAERGSVHTVHAGREVGGLRVVLEDGAWKVDER